MSDDMIKIERWAKRGTGSRAEMSRQILGLVARIRELERERDVLRSWDDYFRSQCGYKRDGRPSPECLDEWIAAGWEEKSTPAPVTVGEGETRAEVARAIAYVDYSRDNLAALGWGGFSDDWVGSRHYEMADAALRALSGEGE